MNTIIIQITAATEGGWSASVVSLETLTARTSIAGAPDISVSEQDDVVAWFESKVTAMGGLDAPRARDMRGPATARIAARFAQDQPVDQDPPRQRGFLKSVGDKLTGG